MGCLNEECTARHSACLMVDTTQCPEGIKTGFIPAFYTLSDTETDANRADNRTTVNLARNIGEIQKRGMKLVCANTAYWGSYKDLCHACAVMKVAGMETEKPEPEKETVLVRICEPCTRASDYHSEPSETPRNAQIMFWAHTLNPNAPQVVYLTQGAERSDNKRLLKTRGTLTMRNVPDEIQKAVARWILEDINGYFRLGFKAKDED